MCPCTHSSRSRTAVTRPIASTDAIVANTIANQRRDGHWAIGTIARPPIEDGICSVPRWESAPYERTDLAAEAQKSTSESLVPKRG